MTALLTLYGHGFFLVGMFLKLKISCFYKIHDGSLCHLSF